MQAVAPLSVLLVGLLGVLVVLVGVARIALAEHRLSAARVVVPALVPPVPPVADEGIAA